MRAFRGAAMAAMMVLLAGCLPVTTTAPVGSTAPSGGDPALAGTWRVVPQKGREDGPGYVHFIAGKNGALTALLVDTGKPGAESGEWSVYRLTTARLGGHAYANARMVSENGKPVRAEDAARNIPLLYEAKVDGTLVFRIIDEDAAKATITAGAIAGTIAPGKNGDVVLTAAPEALDAFLASDQGAALFKEDLLVLKKVE